MSTDRRDFIKRLGGAFGTLSFCSMAGTAFAAEAEKVMAPLQAVPPDETADDEEFWRWVRHSFSLAINVINLNNAGVSPQPKTVVDALETLQRMTNEVPSLYMWRYVDQPREVLREKLATMAGCPAEEVCITRNATEALDTIIFGIPLERGDEVVISNFDYPHMAEAWKQRQMREGIVLKTVNLQLPSEDKQALIDAYVNAFSSRTKVVLITHMMNWTGQVIPAREIAAEARKRNILSIIDGAQSFAQRDYRVSELGADFYGTSLHKWLCAPLGTGMLHVRKDRIADLWPLFPGSDPRSDNIRKFENLGTRSMAVKHAIGTAIDFHHTIGIARKQARLHYLKNYWVDQIKDESRIRIWTPQHAQFSGAIATVSIEGVTGVKLNRRLLTDYAIHTSRVTHEGIDGVRIAPHIYTNTYELDVLVDRLRKIATG